MLELLVLDLLLLSENLLLNGIEVPLMFVLGSFELLLTSELGLLLLLESFCFLVASLAGRWWILRALIVVLVADGASIRDNGCTRDFRVV